MVLNVLSAHPHLVKNVRISKSDHSKCLMMKVFPTEVNRLSLEILLFKNFIYEDPKWAT